MEISRRTQYALLDEKGEPALHYHQDDSCDPIVEDSIGELIDHAAGWADQAASSFLEHMKPGKEYADYTIAREDVIVSRLSGEDKAALQRIKDDNQPDEYVTLSDCAKSGKHLTSCDNDGYCNYCGEH